MFFGNLNIHFQKKKKKIKKFKKKKINKKIKKKKIQIYF